MTTFTFTASYGMKMTTTRKLACGFGIVTRYYTPGIVHIHKTKKDAVDYVDKADWWEYPATESGHRCIVTRKKLTQLGWSQSMIDECIREDLLDLSIDT